MTSLTRGLLLSLLALRWLAASLLALLAAFPYQDVKGSEYEVPTLIPRDGVYPSNPRAHKDYTEESPRCNGYALRGCLTLLASADVIRQVLPAEDAAAAALRQAATFYAAFDEEVRADFGHGALEPGTRFNHQQEKGQFVFEKGIDPRTFRVARGKGVHGGALEATAVLPHNGRIYFPVKRNLAYTQGGWGGAVSVWCNTDPNRLLKTKFCDPIQITQKGANNGGIWFDFNDARPRDLRHGAFPAVPEGQKTVAEDDPRAPMVRVPRIDWKAGDWHHVVLSWKNFDTGKDDAVSALYLDGKLIGEVKGRAIAMSWDVAKAGIYFGVNYVGLLDELGLFGRALTAEEVGLLHARPGLLAPLKKEAAKGKGAAPPAPKLPFAAATAARYQKEYADWAGLPGRKAGRTTSARRVR